MNFNNEEEKLDENLKTTNPQQKEPEKQPI